MEEGTGTERVDQWEESGQKEGGCKEASGAEERWASAKRVVQ